MIQANRLTIIAFLLATVTFSGCKLQKMIKMAQEQQLTVAPSPLEVHANKVDFEISALLPVKMLKPNTVYSLNTFYRYGEQSEEFQEVIEFNAEDFPNGAEQQPQMSKSYSFDYDPAMDPGTLIVTGSAYKVGNPDGAKTTPELEIARGLITTSLLVQKPEFVSYAAHGYDNSEELIPTNINFYFTQGSSALRNSEKSSNRGEQFQGFVAEKNVTRSVSITGTHSPEGSERVNSNLSEDRAQKIEDYYKQQMDKYDYQGAAEEIDFILKPVVESWEQFRDSLQSYSGIDQAEKQKYLSIINGSGSFEEKEDQLHQISTYRKVFADIYPKLRTAQTQILTVKEKKTDAEIAVLSKQMSEGRVDQDTLSDEELMYGGYLTPSLEEKQAIYEAAIKKNDSWQAHNNLGGVYLEQAMSASESQMSSLAENALTQFELSARKQNNAEAHANMAVVYLMQGNAEKASDEIGQALSMTPSMQESKAGFNGIQGAIQIMNAEYEQAVASLSNADESAVNLFNKGLAQVLNKDYENAMTSLEEASSMDSDMALASYVAAIAAAHLGNEDDVFSNLSDAVQTDPDLKGKALNDLEFDRYASEARFNDTLK